MAAPPTLPTFRRWLDARCAAAGDRPFFSFHGRSCDYDELAALTDTVAARFHERGLRPGDRLALALPNGSAHLFAWLGAAKLGAVVAPLHAQWTEPELARALRQLRPRLFVGPDDSSSPLRFSAMDLAASLPSVDAGEVMGWLAGPALPFPDVAETQADAPAELLFTSGTTGLPKAAVQTFRSMMLTGEAFADWLRLAPSDRLFTCLPLAHINARFYSTMGALAAGAALVVEERFSASAFWRWIAESEATVVNTIGAMLRILMMAPARASDPSHRLRVVYTSPALGDELHRAFEARFGVRLVVGYGLTECTFGFIHPVDRPLGSTERHLDSMGRPRRHPDRRWSAGWRLVDPESGRDAGRGEIRLAGPTVFSGYFEDAEATAAAFDEQGWLRTGDLAWRDADDWWTFVGRAKEMIRRRGENLSPLEVEEVLMAHPEIAEAAVVGVPSEFGEEDVAAFLVPRAGAAEDVPADELAAWCVARLARFKVPTEWHWLTALPRTSTNRVAKAELLKLRR